MHGYFGNAARYHPSGEYRTLRDQQGLSLHPTSVLALQNPPPTYVVFSEVCQLIWQFVYFLVTMVMCMVRLSSLVPYIVYFKVNAVIYLFQGYCRDLFNPRLISDLFISRLL